MTYASVGKQKVLSALTKSNYGWQTVWPEKNRQMSIKVAQKWFQYKKIDFDTFTKIA